MGWLLFNSSSLLLSPYFKGCERKQFIHRCSTDQKTNRSAGYPGGKLETSPPTPLRKKPSTLAQNSHFLHKPLSQAFKNVRATMNNTERSKCQAVNSFRERFYPHSKSTVETKLLIAVRTPQAVSSKRLVTGQHVIFHRRYREMCVARSPHLCAFDQSTAQYRRRAGWCRPFRPAEPPLTAQPVAAFIRSRTLSRSPFRRRARLGELQ